MKPLHIAILSAFILLVGCQSLRTVSPQSDTKADANIPRGATATLAPVSIIGAIGPPRGGRF